MKTLTTTKALALVFAALLVGGAVGGLGTAMAVRPTAARPGAYCKAPERSPVAAELRLAPVARTAGGR